AHAILEEIRRQKAFASIKSLDDWLLADRAGSLKYQIKGGSERLDKAVKKSLADSARTRRRTWPLLCTDCGKSFKKRAKQRGRVIRCPRCLAKRLSERT